MSIQRAAAHVCVAVLLVTVTSLARAQASWPGLDPGEPLAVRQQMQFGAAVSNSGSGVLVGAPGTDGHGAAYIFIKKENDPVWHLSGKLVAPDVAPGTFGSDVLLDGGALVTDHQRERVYYFVYNGRKWVPRNILHGGVTGFGAAMATHDCLLFVTSTGSPSLRQPGFVHIFDRCASSAAYWQYVKSFTAPGVKPDELFGASIAIDTEGRLLVGAPSVNGPGAVYYFKNDGIGTDWTFKQRIVQSNPQAGDRGFGSSVAVRLREGLVGEPLARADQDFGTSGVAFILTQQNDGTWFVGPAFRPPASGGWAEFGHGVFIDQYFTHFMVSAPGAFSREFQNPGHLYIYHTGGIGPGPEYDLVGDVDTARFGESFSVSTDWLTIGEPNYRTRPDSTDGAAIVTFNNPR